MHQYHPFICCISFKWAMQLLGNVAFHQTAYAVLDILWRFWDEPSEVSLDHVTPPYLPLTLLKHDFQVSNLLSGVVSGNECFLKMQMPLAGGKQVRELDSDHFSFSLACYLLPHPCRAYWQEQINPFMGWTELAPIIQGVELLNGGNKRLYPLPICSPVSLCPVFGIPCSCVPFVLVIVAFSSMKK